jgi:hypothetical protein
MNRSLYVDLLFYGGILLGLSILAYRLSSNTAATLLWLGIGGGVVSASLGVLGLRGYHVRRWAILAMTILSIALGAQSVIGWLAVRGSVEATQSTAMLLTVLLVLTVGQLVNLIQNRRDSLFRDDGEHRDNDQGSE